MILLLFNLRNNIILSSAVAERIFFIRRVPTGVLLMDTGLSAQKSLSQKKSWLDSLESVCVKYRDGGLNKTLLGLIKGLLKFSKNMVVSLLVYSLLSWVFLQVYDKYGFEKTIIILLIGVLMRGGIK